MTRPRSSLGPQRPLLLTADPALLDDLLRVAAAAATEVQAASDPAGAAASWAAAPLVVLGADLAEAVSRAGLPARAGVLLATSAGDRADVWPLAARAGAEAVLVLPQAAGLLAERLGRVTSAPARATTVAVVPGRGGAGASTLACALAVTARRLRPDLRPLLVDGDPLGGGLDLLLGAEHTPGLRWPALAATRGRPAADELRGALPQVEGFSLLSWDRGDPVDLTREAAGAVLAAGCRGHDLVVLDIPRAPDPAGRRLLAAAGTALLVVPADVGSAAAASRVAGRLATVVPDVRVVVRTPRRHGAAGLGADQVAAAVGLPLGGRLGDEPGLAAAAERGEPPGRSGRGPLARLCRELLGDLVPVGRVA